MWAAASEELGPAKLLGRLDEYNKTLLSTVTLVGTVLTGFGLIASTTLATQALTKGMAAAAVVAAISSAIFALGGLAVRVRYINPRNLADIATFIASRTRRASRARILLVVALLLAMATTLTALFLPTPDAEPALSVVASKDQINVTLRLTATELKPGTPATGWITANVAGKQKMLGQQETVADKDGKATVEVVAAGLQGMNEVQATTRVEGRTCVSTLPVDPSVSKDFGGPQDFHCTPLDTALGG